MIRYIKGTLEMIEEDAVVLDNHGIGYRILVSGALMDRLPGIGGEMKIYTYMNVREDAMQLFGFESMDELEMFCQLITVSGIGPKAGLAFLERCRQTISGLRCWQMMRQRSQRHRASVPRRQRS
jgi:Holliday junction DNA helicase RuvA